MRILFLVGSLTIGAALALSFTQAGFVARLVSGVAVLAIGIAMLVALRRRNRVKPRHVYAAAYEADQFSEAEVREVFHALAEAKARSVAPFSLAKADPTAADSWTD